MSKKLQILAGSLIVVGALVMLYLFSPTESLWFPKCAFKLLTGLDCPSCGGQRAVHAALHGEFATAFALNPFMVLSVPYAAACVLASVGNITRLKSIVFHRYTLSAYVILFFAWWIIRNCTNILC